LIHLIRGAAAYGRHESSIHGHGAGHRDLFAITHSCWLTHLTLHLFQELALLRIIQLLVVGLEDGATMKRHEDCPFLELYTLPILIDDVKDC
jgi:hypothetical protein